MENVSYIEEKPGTTNFNVGKFGRKCDVWNKISPEIIRNLYSSYEGRLVKNNEIMISY